MRHVKRDAGESVALLVSTSPTISAIRCTSGAASYSFIVQLQNGGVAKLHAAVPAFIDVHNEQRLPEQNGFLSFAARREAWYARKVAA